MRHLVPVRVLGGFLLSAAVAIAGCENEPSKAGAHSGQHAHKVICTVVPVYVFTTNVAAGIPSIDVELLLEPTMGCPHDYSLSTGDRKKIAGADAIFAVGSGYEPFLDTLRRISRPPLFELTGDCDLIPAGTHPGAPGTAAGEADSSHEDSGQEAAHEHDGHGAWNAHVWLSPVEAKKMVAAIALRLTGLFPEHAAEIAKNADAYGMRLQGLAEDFSEESAALAGRRFVAHHDIFDYLARDLKLDVVAVLEQHEHGSPSAREVKALIEKIIEAQPVGILIEKNRDERVPRMISAETGVPCLPLDTLTVAEQSPIPLDYYEKTTYTNLLILRASLTDR